MIGDISCPFFCYLVDQAGGVVSKTTSDGKTTTITCRVPIPERMYWDVRYQGMGVTAHEKKDTTFDQVTLTPYLRDGGKILDFGCGLGRHAEWLSAFAEYYGADTSQYAVTHGPSGFKCFPITDKLPFQDGIFQTVFSCQVLKHILVDEELKFWIHELTRVTAPHGLHVHYDITWAQTQAKDHMVIRPKETIINTFHDEGVILDADDYPYPNDLRTVFYGVKE